MEFSKTVLSRRSTRAFLPEAISEEAVRFILSAAYAAPIGMAQYGKMHITVIRNEELLKKIAEEAEKLMPPMPPKPGGILYGAKTLFVVSAAEDLPKMPLMGAANASCVVQNMLLAATDLGLGSVYIMGAMNAFSGAPELLEECGIPKGFKPMGSAAVGVPAEPLDGERDTEGRISVNYV